jgi:hypothetical protein
MSETRKNRETAIRENRTSREALDQGEATAHQAADELRDVGDAVAETVVRTADAAVEMGQLVAEQQREVMLLGVRAAAGMNGRLADAGYGRCHHVVGAAARALNICREAGETTAENVQALFSAYVTLGRGMQQMQHAALDLLDRAVDRATHKPQDLLRCKTLEEFAEVQRDLYLDAVNHALESSTTLLTLLQLAAQTAQQAMRPLHGRAVGNGTAVGHGSAAGHGSARA